MRPRASPPSSVGSTSSLPAPACRHSPSTACRDRSPASSCVRPASSSTCPSARAEMTPGSMEEYALMGAAGIRPPATAATSADRWILIDKTCQILVAGEGDRLVFVFKTSTGEPGWETRNHERVRLYRYNPALDNAGWHNSTRFPVADDNPLNGNMYKPLYFDAVRQSTAPTTSRRRRPARGAPGSALSIRSCWWRGSVSATSPDRSTTPTASAPPSRSRAPTCPDCGDATTARACRYSASPCRHRIPVRPRE